MIEMEMKILAIPTAENGTYAVSLAKQVSTITHIGGASATSFDGWC
jgi:hypothetical protein